MDTNAVKLLLESHGFIVSIHDLGGFIELHAFDRSMTTDVSEDVAAPSDLKIVRVDGNGVKDIAIGMIELARMCGVDPVTER